MPARLALVTGGHRRLGAHIAARLARAGYAVAIHGSHDAEPEPMLAAVLADIGADAGADIGADAGAEWAGFVADFSDPVQATRLMADVVARFGRPVDLLVNSAAMFGQDRLEDMTAETLALHHAVNCAAPALLIQAFARDMGKGRSIVNILDQRLDQPHGDQLSYTLSKYGLAGLTRTAARTLAPAIRVNAVAPGLTIETDDYAADQAGRIAAAMPLGRTSLPADIADAVLYLDRATAVTGQTIRVDGGAHMVSFGRDFMHL